MRTKRLAHDIEPRGVGADRPVRRLQSEEVQSQKGPKKTAPAAETSPEPQKGMAQVPLADAFLLAGIPPAAKANIRLAMRIAGLIDGAAKAHAATSGQDVRSEVSELQAMFRRVWDRAGDALQAADAPRGKVILGKDG